MSNPLENKLIKKAHAQLTYTEQQIIDIACCSDPVTGPDYFCKHFFYIRHPTKGSMLYQPFDYQEKLLNTFHNYTFVVSMLGRQLGKCVDKNVNIAVRNKQTGKIYEMPVGIFHEYVAAQEKGENVPDISIYEKMRELPRP